MKILFLPGSYNSPAARFRVWQFVEPLREMGHEVTVRVLKPERPWSSSAKSRAVRVIHNKVAMVQRIFSALTMLRDAGKFDVVFMNRDIVPEEKIWFLERYLFKRNPRLIFDFDDAIHLSGNRAEKLRKTLPQFAWITPGNETLAEFARPINSKVTILPTVVDTVRYQPVSQRVPGPLRIGWSGSRSTVKFCLPLIKDVLPRIAAVHDIEFVVIADVPPEFDLPDVKVRFIPWSPETEVESLLQIDIGLMPLNDEPFERGKCGAKAILYMAAGIPSLVSPVGVNQEIIAHGIHGFHCVTDEEWLKYAILLLQDPELRERMGVAARQRAEDHYSVSSLLPKMLDVFQAVSQKTG
jgi:glycosyltransferase involved in cell wall biosynthesis